MQTPAAAELPNAGKAARLRAGLGAARPWLAWLSVSLLFGWLLAVLWWALLSPDAREEVSDQLVIPPGTADAIRSGSAVFVPDQVSLRPGTRLLIVNEDVEEHLIGNAVIPPGATAELSAPAGGGGFYCTIHPSGFLGVDVTEPPGILSTVVPAMVIGVPLGLMAGAAAWVDRKRQQVGAVPEHPDGDRPL